MNSLPIVKYGLKDDFTLWLQRFEIQSKLLKVEKNQQKYLLLAWLDDDSLKTFNNTNCDIEATSYEDLINQCKRIFIKGRKLDEMLREFHSMKQNWNESSCEFGNRCLQVGKTTFKDVPDEFRNASIISKYIDGLRNPDLQRELEIRSHTEKIDEMILFAEIYENAERKYGEKMQETKPAKLINQYLECKICQRKNHTTEDCHDLPKLLAMKMNISNENDKVQRPPRKTEVTCYKCGRKGHISTNCGKNDMVGAINEEQNEMILIENEKNELILNWTNEENFAIQFLVDSGCPETLIPVEIWEELNFPPLVKSKGTNLVSINGANLRSIGSCKLKNRTGKTLIAKIMENISRPILGRDSMKQLSISVNYEGAILNSQTALESTKRQTKLRTDDEESSEKEHKENEMDHTVKTVVEEYESVFAEKEFDIGTYEKIRHNIPLKEESTVIHIERKSYHPIIRKEIRQQLHEMLENEVVSKSSSSFCNPVVLVKKKNGSYRFCVDFRKLNDNTAKKPSPIPKIDSLLNKLSKQVWFSKLDINKGFWQIPVAEEDKHKTAFIFENQIYEFNVMPFGLTNAPATFHQVMCEMFGELQNNGISFYLDDVIVYGTNIYEHNRNLEVVLSKLKSSGMKIKREKCSFGKSSIIFLGYEIDGTKIRIDETRYSKLKDYPFPTTKKAIQRLLGISEQFRKFIPNYAEMVSFLNIHDTEPSEEKREKFEILKEKLLKHSSLNLPDFNKSMTLTTDASEKCIASCLMQSEKIIACHSRKLSNAETRYSTIEKEMLAVVDGVQKFEEYLLGTKFEIRTDHKPLLSMNKFHRAKSRRLETWSMRLSEYDFNIVHIPGRENAIADGLSRDYVAAVECNNMEKQIIEKQKMDEECLEWYSQMERIRHRENFHQITLTIDKMKLTLLHDILWVSQKEELTLFIPKSIRRTIMYECHSTPQSGHYGIERTIARVQCYGTWNTITSDIKSFINSCFKCQSNQRRANRNELKTIQSYRPNEIWTMDCLGPLPKTVTGKTYIFLIVDHFSRYPFAYDLDNIRSATICKCIQTTIGLIGNPSTIISDRGTNFTSITTERFLAERNIDHRLSTAFHPQTNGLTERINRELIAYFRKNCPTENQWDEFLRTACESYRTSVNCATGFTPHEIIYGRHPITNHVHNLKELFSTVQKNDRANKERQKKYYDGRKMTQNRTFNIGDRVTLQNNYRTKLQSRFHTKAVINKIYSSRLYGVEGSSKVFNICQIRKLEEPACLTLKEIRNRKNLIIETEVEESEEEIIYVPIIIEETDEPPNEDSRTSLNIVEHNDDMPVIDDGENSPTKFEETNVVIEAEVQEKDEDIEMIHSTPEIIEEVQEETEVLLETIEDKNEDEGNDKEEDEENEADEEHDEEENEEHDLEENEENEADEEENEEQDEEENEEQDEEENEENEAGEEYEEQTEEAMERNKNALREINEDKSEDIIVDDLTPSTTRKKQYCVCNKERNVKFIKCENTDCTISWFHQRCSKLKGRKNVEFIIWLCSAECYDNFRKMGECSSKPIN